MTLAVVLRPEARAEFDEAFAWYEQRRPGLGGQLVAQGCPVRHGGTLKA